MKENGVEMRKFGTTFGIILFASILSLGSSVGRYDHSKSTFAQPKILAKSKTPMHKALFTQRGYIQFLRWELPVPEIDEFTFCLWVKSTNLTYSHSIFSYSKNEEERLMRSWISPFGRSVHLEIGKNEVMVHPTNLEEHRWYHICQSWENEVGRYALWLDGRKEVEGYAAQLVGHVVPSGGDIVVGQEYTDFDKGLEEGIEGAVLGFNFLLASAFRRSKGFYPSQDGLSAASSEDTRLFPYLDSSVETLPGIQLLRRSDEGVSYSDNREAYLQRPERNSLQKIVNERSEGMFDSTLKEYLGEEDVFGRNQASGIDGQRVISLKIVHKSKRDVSSESERSRRAARRIRSRGEKEPLGLQLVNLGYSQCQLGRGSPFIGGSRMLISWTRTPVKVFGGAILKNAQSSCGNF